MTPVSHPLTVALSFGFFLLLFTGIGIYSATRKTSTAEDYLVASRSMGPWMMALSAVATNSSGFMFIGLIGATYSQGLSAMWIMVGWVFGDWLAWRAGIFRKLRDRSEKNGALTIPSFIGNGLPGGAWVTRLGGLLTLLFLSSYAAAQLTAGAKALHVMFGWSYVVGAVLGAIIVAAYCFSGGIRASIWTDVTQSIVMMGAMALLLGIAMFNSGGPVAMWDSLAAMDPQLVSISPKDVPFGLGLFILGWVAAGAGVVGQPHIMVRVLTIKDPESVDKARSIYIGWFALFAAGAIAVGLCARVLLPGGAGFDAELAMPSLAVQLLPSVLIGTVLAGLFSATMSTADSQILSCSAAVTQDLIPGEVRSYGLIKLTTLLVTCAVLGISLIGASVFSLVVLSWSVLAAGLGPGLVMRSLGKDAPAWVVLCAMVAGVSAVFVWRYGLAFSGGLYDALPGMAVGFATYAGLRAVAPAVATAGADQAEVTVA